MRLVNNESRVWKRFDKIVINVVRRKESKFGIIE